MASDTGNKETNDLKKALKECEERQKNLLGEIESVRDIARREYASELKRISTEFTHDLRSPLQTITNCVYLMENKRDLTYLTKINEALKQATDLLDAYRVYYRGEELSPIVGSINVVIEKALADSMLSRSVEVVKELDPSLPDISIDVGKIGLVFGAIVKNAVESMPSGGKLTVKSKLDNDRVVAVFSDTGNGIPDSVQDRVFIPFGAKKKGGLGLSMAAAKRIVEAHGGEIGFKTEPGKGTIFKITLPFGVKQQRNT